MSKGQHSLTADNLAASDHDSGHVGKPQTTHPNIRRMSRMDPRPSVQYSRRMSTVSRTSITGSSLMDRHMGLIPPKLAPTYKLCPEADETFKRGRVQLMMKKVLDEYLDGEMYNPTQCRNHTQMLTDLIKNRVKDMGFNRYKYVVTVTMGQDLNQSMRVVSRFLWNDKTDNYATASYNKDGLYAVATVYACYLD